MPHPKDGYRNKAGKRVSSVTEILKYKDPGPLMYWAWNEGREGRNFRDTSGKAATAGTLCHQMIEDWISHGTIDFVEGPAEELALARQGFKSFEAWAATCNLKIVAQEVSMVSEVHQFAGCMDAAAVAEVNGKLALVDWKLANGVYGDYLCQISAYGMLWEENFPDKPITGGYHLVRFSKDNCDFAHRYWENLDDAKEAFLLLHAYGKLRKGIDARVK